MNQTYPTEQVTERAQQIWEDDGRPEGKAEEHWLRAEEIVYQEEVDLAGTACGAAHCHCHTHGEYYHAA